jgi:SAM-dependent methyltransferase
MIMNPFRAWLRQVPGLSKTYHQTRIVIQVLYQGWWANRERAMDASHLHQVWNFSLPVERERYDLVLRALREESDSDRWGRVLEIGCAEGLFTLELARHCESVTALDISPIACERAAERCRAHPNVQVLRRDLLKDDVAGEYDLIFAMDTLDYVHGRKRGATVIGKLVKALRAGGYLAFCDCRLPEEMRHSWWARWLGEGADHHVETLSNSVDLQLVYKAIYPTEGRRISDYVEHAVALFKKLSSAQPAEACRP